MMKLSRITGLVLFMVIMLFYITISIAEDTKESAIELKKQVEDSIRKGLDWLMTQQNEDGSFGEAQLNPGLTGLFVMSVAKSPLSEKYSKTDSFEKAVKYLVSKVKPDGGIYEERASTVYHTAICMNALASINDPKYRKIVEAAQKFLIDLQGDEKNPSYGGWGYSKGFRTADLSNLQIALTALKESGLSETEKEVFERAIDFVERCQNIKTDGGFIYRPGESKAGVDEKGYPRSYQSMTYAGLLAFIYCKVDKNDKRVKAAVKWLEQHYNLYENYPIGKDGLYYSYHTMAKALAAYGEKYFVDEKREKHDWYSELAEVLIKAQDKEGYWVNTAERWFETDKILVTTYAILALSEGYKGYK